MAFFDCKVHKQKRHVKVGLFRMVTLVLCHVGKQGLEADFSISRERVAVARDVELVK